MKKSLIIIITIFMIFPIKIKAMEYNAVISGENIFFSKPEDEKKMVMAENELYINITNLDNIKELKMYVEYDNELIETKACGNFNFNSLDCTKVSDNKIEFMYKNEEIYKEYIENYNFYKIIFMPTALTPELGITKVTVSFENVIDKSNKEIKIDAVTKSYSFKKFKYIMNDDENEDISQDDENEINYIKDIIIKNYDFEFKSDIKEYNLTVEEGINRLDLDVILENPDIKYTVTGTDNLKENDYKVLIEIELENDEKKIYTINIDLKKEIILEDPTNDENKIEEIKQSLVDRIGKKNILIIASIISGIIFLIVLIILITNRHNNNKIDDLLNDL